MLSKILSKSDCASCKFCCSFRRQSLWETPVFTLEQKENLEKKYPSAKFKKIGKSFTVNLDDSYKTDNPKEESPCPFLNADTGCVLSQEEKPFDCSIWPFRACKKDGDLKVMLENTCQAINKVPYAKIRALIVDDGLGKKILEQARKNPDTLKDYSQEYMIIE